MGELPLEPRGARGDRRPRALGDPGARRLPHARVLRRRSGQRVLAPRGRRIVRGAPRSGRRHPLDRAGNASRRGGRAHPEHDSPSKLDACARDDDVRGQVGLRSRPRHRAGAAARDPRRRRRADLARGAHRAARVRERRRLRRLPPGGGPRRGGRPGRGSRRLPRAGVVRRRGRRGGTSRPVATPVSRCDCTATSSPSRVRSPSRSTSARARSITSRRPARRASRSWRRVMSPACCCRPARSSSGGRCRRPARSSTRER